MAVFGSFQYFCILIKGSANIIDVDINNINVKYKCKVLLHLHFTLLANAFKKSTTHVLSQIPKSQYCNKLIIRNRRSTKTYN